MNDAFTLENVNAKGHYASPLVTNIRRQTVRFRTLSNRPYVRLELPLSHRKQSTDDFLIVPNLQKIFSPLAEMTINGR